MPVVEEQEWDDVAEPPSPPQVADEVDFSPPPVVPPDEPDEPEPTPPLASAAEPEPTFDERFKQDFEGLMFLGRLEEKFVWLGHTFRIKTITGDELLEIGILHKPYRETLADIKAYQGLMVAASLVSVDGRDLPKPMVLDPSDSALGLRFEMVMKWFPPTIDVLYERYLLLETRVQEVLAAMGEASG